MFSESDGACTCCLGFGATEGCIGCGRYKEEVAYYRLVYPDGVHAREHATEADARHVRDLLAEPSRYWLRAYNKYCKVVWDERADCDHVWAMGDDLCTRCKASWMALNGGVDAFL